MAKIKIPVSYKEIDSAALTTEDVDKLLEIYTELAVFQKFLFQRGVLPPPPEEFIKILGAKIECRDEE